MPNERGPQGGEPTWVRKGEVTELPTVEENVQRRETPAETTPAKRVVRSNVSPEQAARAQQAREAAIQKEAQRIRDAEKAKQAEAPAPVAEVTPTKRVLKSKPTPEQAARAREALEAAKKKLKSEQAEALPGVIEETEETPAVITREVPEQTPDIAPPQLLEDIETFAQQVEAQKKASIEQRAQQKAELAAKAEAEKRLKKEEHEAGVADSMERLAALDISEGMEQVGAQPEGEKPMTAAEAKEYRGMTPAEAKEYLRQRALKKALEAYGPEEKQQETGTG